MLAAAATGAVALAAWIYLAAARGGFWRVRESAAVRSARRKSVAVIIPARNEAEHVAAAVRSLLRQDYAGDIKVCVVDDHSDDATSAMARDAGATVVAADPLPEGWTGKMWAVSQGVRQACATAPPDYLMLTDADIIHAPDAVASLVARAETDWLDLVSYMVLLRASSPAEKLLIPAFVFFFLKLYPPAWIADPRAKTAGAAGGCILVRREALERIGGIESIRGELIDDCALAARVKGSGGRIWMGLTRSTVSMREYARADEIWRMIARTAFTQLRCSGLVLAGTVACMILIYVAPVGLLFSGDTLAAVLGGSAWALMSLLYLPMLRLYRLPRWYAPMLPAVALFYTGATLDSALRHWTGRGGMWKGRVQAPVSKQTGAGC